ncbi:MAG: co-chaperone GroES [Candidatus Pacebacteria bacterium]|nr:co-chaperone GroES [Candidatus Paceibacterota bacterium]
MIKPLFNKVLIAPESLEKKTESGIVLPDTAKENSLIKGKIVAVGSGRISEKGEYIPMSVKEGEIVLFRKGYSADEIEMEGKKYYLVSEDEILGIL